MWLTTISIFWKHCRESKRDWRSDWIEWRKYLRDFSSFSCSAAELGTEQVLIDRRVTGAVVDDEFFDCSVVDEDERSNWLSSFISSFTLRLGLILFEFEFEFELVGVIEFFGEK